MTSALLCAATDLECALLRERLGRDPGIQIVRMGVGPVNAAHAAAVAIITQRPDVVIVCGVGGAYPGSGLAAGDVVSAEIEIYGDLGAQSPTGFLDMKKLGFPVVPGPAPLYNELPLQVFPTIRRAKFVTVSTCTGTHATALEIERRTQGSVENMEGAAVVHVAHLHGIPVGEVRGISNIVTNRDTTQWRLKDAATAAQEALLAWIGRR